MTDSETLTRLGQVLAEQAQIYDALLELSLKKQQTLLQGGLGELEVAIKSEQALLWQAGRLEEARLSMQAQLAASLGRDSGSLTLGDLIEAVEEPFCTQYRDLQRDILGSMGKLQRINELNTQLIRQSLAFINYSLNLLVASTPAGGTYNPSGQVVARERGNRMIIDQKF